MLCSPPGPSSWKPWPSLGLLRARPAEQRLNLPHPNQPTPPHPKNPKGELVDQMGTGPTNPSPRELSLSNQTRFSPQKSGKDRLRRCASHEPDLARGDAGRVAARYLDQAHLPPLRRGDRERKRGDG